MLTQVNRLVLRSFPLNAMLARYVYTDIHAVLVLMTARTAPSGAKHAPAWMMVRIGALYQSR